MDLEAGVLELARAIEETRIAILKVDFGKVRPIYMKVGPSVGVDKFLTQLSNSLGEKISEYPILWKSTFRKQDFHDIFTLYVEKEGLGTDDGQSVIPNELKDYTLNIDISSEEKERYFLTTEDE